MDNLYDEMPYKKGSKRKPPKKADHKHEYESVLFEWWNPDKKLDSEKGFVGDWDYSLGRRCKICGRLQRGKVPSFYIPGSRAYQLIQDVRTVYSNLPIVRIKDLYSREIELDEGR